jgi:hypothetical protein
VSKGVLKHTSASRKLSRLARSAHPIIIGA